MPVQIMTREAFENAIVTCYALGGSTNMVLHCLALAKEANVSVRAPSRCLLPPALQICAHMHIRSGGARARSVASVKS